MLKLYRVGKKIFQFEPEDVPAGAEEIIEGRYQPSFQKNAAPATKARKTANKSKKPANKAQEAEDK